MSQGNFFFRHVLDAVRKTWRIVAYSKGKIKRSLVATLIFGMSTEVNHDAHVHAGDGK
jgi:hypothetical protein